VKEVTHFNDSIEVSGKEELKKCIHDFDTLGNMLGKGKRNIIKIVDTGDGQINIKSFKIPNIINQLVYRFFRKSKAERSFEFAHRLLDIGINTPKPLAYFEYKTPVLFKKSFYLSEHLKYDLTYRELINDKKYPDYDIILRAFTRFTFQLHEKGINFLDHSPGNTLIVKKENEYSFYLIDLNRMEFQNMSFRERMNNFAKLSPKDHMLEVMADEYAQLFPKKSKEETLKTMSYFSENFSSRYNKREQFKKKYYFWRK